MLHITAGLCHVRIVGHDKKGMLIIHQLLTFTYHGANTITLLVQILQFLFFDDIVGFLLIGVVHVAFQVYHILQCSESGLFQQLTHIVLIPGFAIGIHLLQEIPDMFLQRVDTFLHTQHANLLVDVQYFFKEVQVVTLNFNGIAGFHQHAIIYQFSQPSFISTHKFNSKPKWKLHQFSFLKHFTQQSLLT